MSCKKLVLLMVVVVGLSAADDKQAKSERSEFKKSLKKDCAYSYSLTCLKLDILSWVDKLDESEDYVVLPGVSVIRENVSEPVNTSDAVAEVAREFPSDPDARLDAFLMKKINSYLNTHSVKLNLWNPNGEGRGKGGGGGGGGGKKGGGMGILLAAAAMMKGTLMAIALKGIALIAGKALMTGLISLLLSAIIGLKALTHGGHKQTTYEIVAKPVYSHVNTHSASHEEHGGHYGHSSYGRSFDVPLPLGLQPTYNPAQ